MGVTQAGRQSWLFEPRPGLIGMAAVAGKSEAGGPLASGYDKVYEDFRIGQKSFEKAEQQMLQDACTLALQNAELTAADIDLFLAGDLLNQITVSNFTARNLGIPHLGLFAACSTSTQGLALAGLLVASGAARRVLAASGSHTCTAERQFRYPNEYGCQKPPHTTSTVMAAGAGVVAAEPAPIQLVAATVGRVVDKNITDPFNMGAAMAAAAADTILAHLHDTGRSPQEYDFIITGDLGQVGREIAWEVLQQQGFVYDKTRFVDCGCLIYGGDKRFFSGGSGCGCAASSFYGYFCRRLREGKIRRILLAATGALLSPTSQQQKESIPGISHAVTVERV